MRANINEMRRVHHVNLGRVACNVWKARHGQDLPEIFPFGDTFPNIGVVWTQKVDVANGDPLYTTYHYPPLVSDEYAITLPDSAGVAFPWKKMATNALYWWIICTIPIKQNRSWAKKLLGEHESSLLLVNQQPRCTLSWDSGGSIWIKHKGNKYLTWHLQHPKRVLWHFALTLSTVQLGCLRLIPPTNTELTPF
jgi:hypothetical protein